MLRVKTLDRFVLQGFLPLFMMTFCICLFIVLMQFLWRYIDELVGKGLEVSVIAELFFYAAVTMVPMALPLAILLASLMLFGNLGERFELTAIKSAGISLLRTMRPLILLLAMIAVGAFFFQNYALPKAQVKMWTLLFSMRQKSPELDIPEGVFYDQIDGYSVFVKQKNLENGHLYNLMIYDVSSGFNKANIILADSGKLCFTADKKHLYLKLWKGESFENLQEQQVSSHSVPYRRETFDDKEIMIPFDAGFTRMDDSLMRKQYVGKNIAELRHTIDSVTVRIDSIGKLFGTDLQRSSFLGVPNRSPKVDKSGKVNYELMPFVAVSKPVDVNALLEGKNTAERQRYVARALDRAKQLKSEYEFRSYEISDEKMVIRRHQIEMHRKFTLSIACLVFFFIGAPLGAIIRKGGIGAPIVISVLLFIVYYIIDTAGYKLARDGRWDVWEGMWISTAVLLPLGIFLTHKAVNDSAVFKAEVYVDFIKKFFGASALRHIEMKEVIIDEVNAAEAINRCEALKVRVNDYLNRYKGRQSYFKYWINGIDIVELHEISNETNVLVDYLANSKSQLVINKLMDMPILKSLLFYHPTNNKIVGYIFIALFPVGYPIYLLGCGQQKQLKKDLAQVRRTCDDLKQLHLDIFRKNE